MSLPNPINVTYVSPLISDTFPYVYIVKDTDNIINIDTTHGEVHVILRNIRNSGMLQYQPLLTINDGGNNASVNNITIYPSEGDVIQDSTEYVLSNDGANSIIQISNINQWVVLSTQSSASGIAIDFTSTLTTAELFEQIDFTAISSDTIVNYYWEFGDGTFSDLQNPSKTYINVGTYNVTLTVSNNDEESGVIIKTNYITITDLPFNAQTNAIIGDIYANGGTVSLPRRVLMNELILDLLGLGTTGVDNVLADLSILRIYVAENLVSSKVDWCQNYGLAQVVGTIGLDIDLGFRANGSINSYIDNLYNPSLDANVTQDNMFSAWYFNFNSGAFKFTGCNDGTRFIGAVLTAGGSAFTRYNSGGSPTVTMSFANTGFMGLIRENSTEIKRILDSNVSTPFALTSVGKPNSSLVTFGVGLSAGGASETGHNSRCAIFVNGKTTNFTQLYDSLYKYLLVLGAQ
jgi:PKD repeat protein